MTTLHTVLHTPTVRVSPASGRLARLLNAAHAASTPALLIDPDVIAANYQRISAAFGSHIYYAVKANPHPTVLGALIAHGSGLDVASRQETELALALGVPADRICYSAPFKRPSDVAFAHRRGVRLYVADSAGEVDNIARNAPGARILIRAAVGDSNCLTPMGRKFGANLEDIVPLLLRARDAGLLPYGLHFHVGSQCCDVAAWANAIALCAPYWHAARALGLNMQLMDIGGGFPVRYDGAVPSIEAIARVTLAAAHAQLQPGFQFGLEPGRWMTRNAAILVTEVIGTARRGTEDWVYLDAGVYNGLIDTTEGVRYPLRALDELAGGRRRPRRRVTLAGPSCDGNDVMMRNVLLPELAIGDRLLVYQAGAYTTSFERFNGLAYPGVVSLVPAAAEPHSWRAVSA